MTVRRRNSPCRELSEVRERCCTWVEHPSFLFVCFSPFSSFTKKLKKALSSCTLNIWVRYKIEPAEGVGVRAFPRRCDPSSGRVAPSVPPPSFLPSLASSSSSPPLSLVLTDAQRTGWGTTALCKTSLFKPPGPAPCSLSPSPPSFRPPLRPQPISGERRKGSRMISRAANGGRAATSFVPLSRFNWRVWLPLARRWLAGYL